jgi:hypothetical protein
VSPDLGSTTEEHPAVRVLRDLWPALTGTLAIFGSVPTISESVAKLFKNVVNLYRIHSLPLLAPMAESLVSAFERYEYGCFLHASGAIVRQFTYEKVAEDARFVVRQFVERQFTTAFALLQRNELNDVPDCKSFFCFY